MASIKTHLTYKVPAFWLFLLFLWFSAQPVKADKAVRRTDCQSMQGTLPNTVQAIKEMTLLQKLATLHRHKPEEVYYQKRIVEIATALDSFSCVYKAISQLERYYSNALRLDSLLYWSDIADSIARKRGETPDVLFHFHNYTCRYYLRKGDFELAMNEAMRLHILSTKTYNRPGLVSSNENLGMIYLLIGRNEDSINAFEEALRLLKESNNQPIYELQILSYLLIPYLRVGRLNEMNAKLIYAEHLLDNMENSGDWEYTSYPFQAKRCLIHSYYIELYVAQNKPHQAVSAVQRASSYMNEAYGGEITTVYHQAMARYYHFTRQYASALDEINKVLALDYSAEPLQIKADILEASGNKAKTLEQYKALVDFIQNQNITAFTRQIDQLRTLHHLNDQEMQTRELTYRKEQIEQKQKQLVISFTLSGILFVLLYFVVIYAYRTRNFKNALQKERNSLLESEEKLRLAKEKAEEANHMKSTFIANIRHEIRTPLNAIIGFAQLLDEASPKERADYLHVIYDNSESLLNLVNDVLDLSSLESNTFQIYLTECLITLSCENALNKIRPKLAPGVKLTFTHPKEPITIRTDSQGMEQILVHLLTNAAKFTSEGEIRLDIQADKELRQLVIRITDTGCGISADNQQLIFNPFEKINEFKQGGGLGLPICRRIAALLGGTVTLDTTYTEGSRFIVTLPME